MVAGAALVLLAGCGSASTTRPAQAGPVAGERQWVDNAQRFLEGLVLDVQLSAYGGSNLASARRALRDQSDLYSLLVAYIAFDRCTRTLVDLGAPVVRLRPVADRIGAAC